MIDKHINNYLTLCQLLLGEISGNVAGVTLNIENNVFSIRVIFFKSPDEFELESFEDIEAEFISSHEKRSDLSVYVLNRCELEEVKGNLGWVFLRKEAIEN